MKQSTRGVSKYAYWSDFLGNVFCGTQLQIDSVIAGYHLFINDPHFNLAKALIAFFGTVNTIIILTQIYIIYKSPEDYYKNYNVYDEEIRSPNATKKLLLTPLLSSQLTSTDIPTNDQSSIDNSSDRY